MEKQNAPLYTRQELLHAYEANWATINKTRNDPHMTFNKEHCTVPKY